MISRRSFFGGATAVATFGLGGCAQGRVLDYDGPPVTGVVVQKAPRRMYLVSGATTLRAFDVELGGDPVGPKRREGDGRTPEGAYWIDKRNPNSAYHLSIGISYPNARDLAFAAAAGVPPGGDIFIHGTPRDVGRADDWTAGCIAVMNREMEEIYAMVRTGTPITIYP